MKHKPIISLEFNEINFEFMKFFNKKEYLANFLGENSKQIPLSYIIEKHCNAF